MHHRLVLVLIVEFALACRSHDAPTGKPAGPEPLLQPQPDTSPIAKPDCTFKGGLMKEDTTFSKSCSPYILQGGIDVLADVTLTIEPGVEVRFADGDWLEIAANSTRGGRMLARGTAEEPIVLTSVKPENAKARSWFGLWFAAGTRDSILSHVVIRYGGGNNTFLQPPLVHGCLTITDVAPGAVTLDHVRLENCLNAGIVMRKSRPVIHDVAIEKVPIGFLLDGVDPKSVAKDARFESVANQVVEGHSTL